MSFFDESYYIQAKLAQLKAAGHKDANGNDFTVDVVKQGIANTGMSLEAHYNSYGRNEGLNANAYFNENEYLHSKLKSLQSDPASSGEWAGRSTSDLKEMMGQMGLSPADHYKSFGYKETTADGCLLNPSNAFDANAYMAAKLAQLQKTDPDTYKDMTVAALAQEILDTGINPVDHYLNYGAAEASSAEVPLVQTVPSEQRVPNDPNRSSVTGEIVPGNYNKPTPAPTSPDAKPGPVLKPADVGGKADPSVSPPVKVPTAPVPVPGDANYVAPPGGGILDTNAKPVVPPSSSTGNWAQVNPDGSADLIKPDGGSGGTLPPGSINPDAPVVPETPGGGESGGGSGGESGGGSGGESGGDDGGGGGGTPPVQAAGITMDLSSETGKQSLTLGTGNDTVTGVLPKHLEFVGLTGNGFIRGGQGMDTITLEAGKYDLHAGQLGSFETVNLENTTQDFTWRIGSSDFPTGTFQPTAQTSIKAGDLSGGKIWVDLPKTSKLTLDLETADNADDILLRLGDDQSVVNMNTKGGDDTLVLVGALNPSLSSVTITDSDTGFTDIGKGAPNGSWFAGGKIDMGAGDNTLKIYGYTNLTMLNLEASSGGTLGLELTNYRSEVDITHDQFSKLKNIQVTALAGGGDNATSFLSIKGNSTKTIDMSQVSIDDGAHVNFILQGGINISDTPGVTSTANKGTWGYRITGDVGATYKGTSGSNEIFEIDQSALKDGRYTGNSNDDDRVILRLKDNGTDPSTLTLNAGGSDGYVNDFRELVIMSATTWTSGVPTFKASNVKFGKPDASNKFVSVSFFADSNDTLDITNLAGTPSVNLGGGNDKLTGLTAGLFELNESGQPVCFLNGGNGLDEVTVAKMDAALTVYAHLQNFETVTFESTDKDVTWTLSDDNYRYTSGSTPVTGLDPTSGTDTVTVDASALTTGQLTFDAKGITVDTFGFNVTGGDAADTFTGSKGADTFTGGGGADKFVYSTLGKSLAATHDTITDFVSTTDKIVVSSDQKSAIDTATTGFITVNGSSASGADIATKLADALNTSGDKMLASGAAVVTLDSGTYLVLNDGTAAFDAAQDDVIKIESVGVGSVTVLSTDIISA